MPSVEQTETQEQRPVNPSVLIHFRVPREVNRRLRILAAMTETPFATICAQALERSVAEKERELGLPQQTHQGAA